MSETSEEIAMSETSEEFSMPAVGPQENPPPDPNYSFYLKMKPFGIWKLAIEGLVDPNFNNDGYGMVGAASDSFVISVKDNDNATATLLLKSSGTIEFQNYAPPPHMVELLASLRFIDQVAPCRRYLDGDDDTVVIFHVKGTNRLCFEFGTDVPRSTTIWTDTFEIPCVTMFPNLTVLCAITVPSDDISKMSDYILREEDPSTDTVFVDWKEGVATFQIGSVKKWPYLYDSNKNERPFHCWFNWKYTTFMRKASILADTVRVHFLTVPEQHVLFQFPIGESADLFLQQKARLVITDMSAEEGAPDEDVSNIVTLDTLHIF